MAVSGNNNTIRLTKKGVRWIADIPGGSEVTILTIMAQISGIKSVTGTLVGNIEKDKVYLPSNAPKFTTFQIPEDFIHDDVAPIKLSMVFSDPATRVHIGDSGSPVATMVLRDAPGAKNINDSLTFAINQYMEQVLDMQVQSAEAKPLITVRKGRYVHICVYVTLLEDGDSYGSKGEWVEFDNLEVMKFRGLTATIMEEFFQVIRPMSKIEFEDHQKAVEEAFELTEKDTNALQDE